jgi:hypothetical protein
MQRRQRARTQSRRGQEWVELIETVVPAPSRRDAGGLIMGGDPVAVLVRIDDDDAIRILEPVLSGMLRR